MGESWWGGGKFPILERKDLVGEIENWVGASLYEKENIGKREKKDSEEKNCNKGTMFALIWVFQNKLFNSFHSIRF